MSQQPGSYQARDISLRKTAVYSNPSTHDPSVVEDGLDFMRRIDNILVDLIIYNSKYIRQSVFSPIHREKHSTHTAISWVTPLRRAQYTDSVSLPETNH